MGRILAIDYGTKRTGIAVSDPLRLIAGGLETVLTRELERWLADYFAREEVSTIVVGKRYRRQDAIGTPFCVTVDGQTLEDGTVTVRHRDSMEQERVQIEALPSLVEKECSYRRLFGKLNL